MVSGAAATTTAVALTFTLYYIAANARVRDRLSQEIRSAFEAADQIIGQSTGSLAFLDAVIHECNMVLDGSDISSSA
jgi:cytochrome P450